MTKKKIAIIGGGAAGMMAAATLVEKTSIIGPFCSAGIFSHQREDIEVHLFEKNSSLGAKVIISGGGRCNVTTGYYRRKDLASKYVRGAERVREAIRQFGPRKIYQRFEQHGVPLKTEADMRVFPVSDDGKDIVGVFERVLNLTPNRSLGQEEGITVTVKIHFKTGIEKISKISEDLSPKISQDGGQFLLHTSQGECIADAVIIATGGNAYSHTGSTGDAYDRARSLGHTVTPLGPSLNSFLSRDKWTHELSGIAFQKAKIVVEITEDLDSRSLQIGIEDFGRLRKKIKKEAVGPVLLTHFGLTGPATFIVAAYSAFQLIDGNHPLEISLSIDADKSANDRHEILLQASKDQSRKQIATILKQYLPDRIVDAWNKNVCSGALSQEIGLMSKIVRTQIVDLLTAWKFTIIGRRPGDEFVTAGGVSLDEVDHKTMMSKIVPGLFFAGEVLDVDGVTGGYNLTSSWATGRLAGESATTWLCNGDT